MMPLLGERKRGSADSFGTLDTNAGGTSPSRSSSCRKDKLAKMVKACISRLATPGNEASNHLADCLGLIERIPASSLHKESGRSYQSLAAKEIEDVESAKRVPILEEYVSVQRVPQRGASRALTVREMLSIDPERRAAIKRNVRIASERARKKLEPESGSRRVADIESQGRERQQSRSQDRAGMMPPPLPLRSPFRKPVAVGKVDREIDSGCACPSLPSSPTSTKGAKIVSVESFGVCPTQVRDQKADWRSSVSAKGAVSPSGSTSSMYIRTKNVRTSQSTSTEPQSASRIGPCESASTELSMPGNEEPFESFLDWECKEEMAHLDNFHKMFHKTQFKVQQDLQRRLPIEKSAYISAEQVGRAYLARMRFLKTAEDRGWMVTDPAKEELEGIITGPMIDLDEEVFEYIWAVIFLERCENDRRAALRYCKFYDMELEGAQTPSEHARWVR